MPMNPNKRRNRGSLWEFLLTYGYLAAVPVIIVGLLTLVEVLEGAGLTSKRLAVILICALVVAAFLLIEKHEDRIRARLKSAQGDPAGAKGGKGPAPTEPAGLVPGKSGPAGAVRADGRGRRIDRAFDTPDEKPESGAAKAPAPPLPSTPPTGEPDMPLDDAARTLRDRIIAEIARKPSDLYELSSLAWDEAASCFPTSGGRKWDGAWFYLELDTGRLSVKVSTYPNQFGASYDAAFGISPAAFHRIAAQYGFSRELQRFRTEEDWARLFDDALKSAVSDALAEVQWLEGQKQESLRDQYAVRIPSRLAAASPKMNIQRIALELNQPYASSRLTLTPERGTYLLNYALMSISATQNKALHREASAAEAAWIEEMVDRAVKDPDDSTWQSLPGGDIMSIEIQRKMRIDIALKGVQPMRKYSNLLSEFANLAMYGSIDETLARGIDVFESEQRRNPFLLTERVGKIRVHEYFTSSHDDTAISVSLIGADGGVLWETTISDDRESDAYELTDYLQRRFKCPVERIDL